MVFYSIKAISREFHFHLTFFLHATHVLSIKLHLFVHSEVFKLYNLLLMTSSLVSNAWLLLIDCYMNGVAHYFLYLAMPKFNIKQHVKCSLQFSWLFGGSWHGVVHKIVVSFPISRLNTNLMLVRQQQWSKIGQRINYQKYQNQGTKKCSMYNNVLCLS